jgi:hypothetical protein
MKLFVIVRFMLVLATTVGLGACATTQPIGITADPSVSLPATFDKIWYRTAKVRPLGLAYEETGRLTVREDSLEFAHQEGVVSVPTKDIEKVSWGKLSPDITNDWVIVHLTGAEPGALVAFKGALFSGSNDSQIYSAVLRAASKK